MQSLPSVVPELSEVAGGKTMRIDKDNYYLNIAKAVAARSTCLRRQYGAVIVADDEIIATGYNGANAARWQSSWRSRREEHSPPGRTSCNAFAGGRRDG